MLELYFKPNDQVSIHIRPCDRASGLLSKLRVDVAEAPNTLRGKHICHRLVSTLRLPKRGVMKVLRAFPQQPLSGVQGEQLQQPAPDF